MSKILITSGCSFSECISNWVETWPKHLARLLPEYEHNSYAMGSQGNGLISRGIIYGVTEALKQYKAEDILVGVMWSASNRMDFRCTNKNDLEFVIDNVFDGWIENPTNFIDGAPKNWVIMNHHWRMKEAHVYYKMFFDFLGGSIYSLEHILRVQWFLKQNNIKYFFTDFCDENIVDNKTLERNDVEIMYLYNQIDRNHYLPVSSEETWCKENSKFTHLWPNNWRTTPQHPMNAMHKEFTDMVIFPWLQSKGYV